jgi:hypothetical protein
MQTVTHAERPELLQRAWEETIGTIPEYNHHGDMISGPRRDRATCIAHS